MHLDSAVARIDTTSIAVSSTMLVLSSLDTCVEIVKVKSKLKFFLAGGALLCAKDFVFQVSLHCFLR